MEHEKSYVAFAGSALIVQGSLIEVALKVKEHQKKTTKSPVLIFDEETGAQMDLNLSGTTQALRKRLEKRTVPPALEETKAGPGRPKLGVVAKEVTLLPRHWEWLASQPGGASVTIRTLVEEARKKNAGRDRKRQSQEAAYRFMNALAGNHENYEEALRSLYAGDEKQFMKLIAGWSADIRTQLKKMAAAAFA